MASGDLLIEWGARDGLPRATNSATPDSRNEHPVLDFDGATDEEIRFEGRLPPNYAGGGLTLKLSIGFTTATTGTSRWQADIERILSGTLDIDADSFSGTFQSQTLAAPGTSGIFTDISITFTSGAQMDSAAAGDRIRVVVRRDADGTSGTDDITTDAELGDAALYET